ncbi:flagellar basal-body MS-ring/collar protein FliF [Treponema parvum]
MMNEWLKKFIASLKGAWAKWTIIQKGILFGIVAVAVFALILLLNISSKPTTVRLFGTPITDENARNAIIFRLDQENVETWVDAAGYISVANAQTAYRMRDLLLAENLVPSNVNPYAFFDQTNWATTDFDREIQWQRATTQLVKQHLEALSDVTYADVNIVKPERTLFASEQNPVTASVILKVVPGSDLLTSRRRILGVQNLLLKAVEGLTAENVTIADGDGNILNDFGSMADSDRVDIVAKEQKLIQKLETEYRAKVLRALQTTLTEDRVRDLNIKIDMDMSKRSSQSTEYKPITIRADNPDTVYDDSELRDTFPISSQTVTKEWQGTGYNPEGPAGTEGQTPPVYSDMSNVIGRSTETAVTQNNVINTTTTQEERSPTIDRITVSVNIDGTWTKKYDKNHNLVINDGRIDREYTPVSHEDLEKLADYVRNSIGYDRARGYAVTVTNIQFDRTSQFAAEDEAYFRAMQTRMTVLMILGGLALILLLFIIVRFIARELERRKRLREEELLRRQQSAREQALWDAKEEGMEVSMSVEERRRAELQENAIAMAKEHPEDVAMLVRTWLMEE